MVTNDNKKRVWHDIQPKPVRPTSPKPAVVPVPAKKIARYKRILVAISKTTAYKWAKKQYDRTPKKVRIIIAIVGTLLIIFGIYLLTRNTPTVAGDATPEQIAAQRSSNVPNYPTILPRGKTIQMLGGWIRVSPLDKNPVFAYADKLDLSTIKVSEQPLPSSFKEDTDQKIEQLLGGFKSHEKIIAGNTDVHLGTAENDSQSAIFYQDNLLVLITSTNRVSNDKWIDYITSLE